jgi:oligoendopeptidase F
MKDKWDLTKIYKDEDAFLKDVEDVKTKIIPGIVALEGKLSTEEGFKSFLDLEREANSKISHLAMFASMRSDLDKKNVENASALSKIELLINDYVSASAYSNPEILKAGKKFVDSFFEKNPDYKDFDFEFEKLFRSQKFVLPALQEKLLSYYSPIGSAGSTLYSQLSVSDYAPKKVTLKNGKEVEVNQANWTTLVSNADCEEDRQAIFESLYSWYEEHKNIYGEIYNTTVQTQLAEMKARGYSSILQEHLYNNNIPESVFHNLIEVASTHAEPLHKYLEIRRKYLGLDHHRSYDRFIQLAKSEKTYTYEEARQLFFKSIEKFPKDFQDKAHEVSSEGYVDVYHTLGKRTGAYSSGGEDIHPYILLNFNGELDDVFTLAHESGHSVHTMYSEESQPMMKQSYTIFVAEIASTFNEHNLLDYLMESGTLSKNDKIALLQKSIDEIMSTFYRQTLFGHFEYNIAKMAEEGHPINYQVLCDEMIKLYKTYYGIDISEEKVKPFVWAYIPHLFYTPFYVYQYATSFTASMLIYENVKSGKEHAFENYINMLRSGGSTYPIDEVKIAGVDLTKKEAFLVVADRMKQLVDELEKLLAE